MRLKTHPLATCYPLRTVLRVHCVPPVPGAVGVFFRFFCPSGYSRSAVQVAGAGRLRSDTVHRLVTAVLFTVQRLKMLALAAVVALGGALAAPLGPTVTLRGGVVMPSVGSGSMGGCGPDSMGTKDGSPCAQYNGTMLYLKHGGRALHDALSYGNQWGTGAAVKDAAKLLNIKREEVFMMSMVPREMMGYNLTKRAVAASLEQLQVDYIDLVMFHHRAADISAEPLSMSPMKAFPDHPDGKWGPPACSISDPTWQLCQDDGWRALIELKKAGKIKAIGVSNWMLSNLKRMKSLGQELPAVNQVEAHIGWHEDDLNEWCIANGVVLQAATPFARGLPDLVKPGANKDVTDIATK